MTHWDDPADRDGQSHQFAQESAEHYQERVDHYSRLAVDSPFPAVRQHAREELAKYQERLRALREPGDFDPPF